MKKIPMRRCLATGQSFPKKEMLRIVRTPEGEVVVDESGKRNGKGAYLSKTAEALQIVRKKKDDDDRRVRAEDLEKKEYGEIKPEYSEEELEEIRLQEEQENENSWINDDDIDFDEYDEYYEEDN